MATIKTSIKGIKNRGNDYYFRCCESSLYAYEIRMDQINVNGAISKNSDIYVVYRREVSLSSVLINVDM